MLTAMNAAPRGIPLRPDVSAIRDAAVSTLTRECLTKARQALGDRVVTRAATAPTTTSSAPGLTQTVAAFLSTLVPFSAGADLLERSLTLRFDGANAISLPTIALGTPATFIAEGAPIPVRQYPTAPGPTLRPYKLATIATLTSEMVRSVNAEQLIRQALIDSAAPGLDAAMFSTAAEVLQQNPAGLLNGIAPLTASSGGSGANRTDALLDDLKTLTSALSPVAGKSTIVFVVNPVGSISLRYRVVHPLEDIILPSAAVPVGTIVAVATNAVAAAIEGEPTISASKESAIEMQTTPAPDPMTGGPVYSMLQMDGIALKMRWPISWALRDPRGVAWLQSVNW
jgi:hypothetical protein